MQCTDPISDLLTRIRNAQSANHDVVSVPASKMKISITHRKRQKTRNHQNCPSLQRRR